MKVITITEKNMKIVYGRLKKFFYNNNRTGFEEWHNFDCGFKRHISPIIYIGKDRVRNINKYPSPNIVEYIQNKDEESRILLKLTVSSGDNLYIGDKIAFCGNRIIYRTKFSCGNIKYIYTVFQVLPMEQSTQDWMKFCAERENIDIYEADYCMI